MSNSKKIISLLLSVIMIMSVWSIVPFSANAAAADSEDYFRYTILDDGTAEIKGYTGDGGDITIPSTHGRYTVTSIGNYAFTANTSLTGVTIPDSVTSIGDYVFWDCTSLASVDIPDSVTSIGSFAFNGCASLASIDIPDSVTDIGRYAFEDCTSLTSIDIPASVTSIYDSAFEGCAGLTGITVAESNTVYDSRGNCNAIIETESNCLIYGCKNTVIPDSVTSIGWNAFYGCTGLTSIVIPDSVTYIDSFAFYNCTGLTIITVDPDNTVYDSRDNCNAIIETDSNELIYGCKNTVIPDTVTSIGFGAFEDCVGLTSITIPNSVETIDNYAFSGCTGLTSIEIPDSVDSIGEYAFNGCMSLTSIVIPDSVTSIGKDAFCGCTGLTSITVDPGNTVYDSRDNCNAIIETESNELICGCKNTVIPDSVTSIVEFAFYKCTDLTSIDIPDSVTSIGWKAFSECTGLTSINILDSIKSIEYGAFESCTSLTSIDLPDSVTNIGGCAFYNCTNLPSIVIPDSVTSIGYHAFGYYYDKSVYGDEKVEGFTIYGYEGSEAQRYAEVYDFTFIKLKPTEKIDITSGIIASVPDDVVIRVLDVRDQMPADGIIKAYDISLLKDGEAVQPENAVTVKIPCDNPNAKVYRVEDGWTLIDMKATYNDGYYVFYADHFSVYVVAASQTGVTVSGSIKSYIDDSDVTIKLIGIDNNYTDETKGTVDYTFDAVPAGKYTMTVSKANHVTAEYSVTVAGADVTQDVEIFPLGDVTGDGKTNVQDCTAILRYVRQIDELSDDQLKRGDVTGDNKVNVQDVTRILRHVRQIEALY